MDGSPTLFRAGESEGNEEGGKALHLSYTAAGTSYLSNSHTAITQETTFTFFMNSW